MALPSQVDCCIAGGGPAGVMLGLLLARAGVNVLVLEKHADFLRDFRGDTVHPSTLQVLDELELLPAFLQRPHDQVTDLKVVYEGQAIPVADFTHLPTAARFLALMPQWDFLDFLAEAAHRYPSFHLQMDAEVTGLTTDPAGRTNGVSVRLGRYAGISHDTAVQARLVVAADGRHSLVREAARLKRVEYGAPMDVLWMRLPRQATDPDATAGHLRGGRLLVLINRGSYWQAAYLVAKGGYQALQERGIEQFRHYVREVAPFLHGRLEQSLPDWEAVKLLTVTVDRLRQWHRPGLLCIGDAAHAMSPIGGVGINLAVQDAVATANLLSEALAGGASDAALDALLPQLQRRRNAPVALTQAAQRAIQARLLAPLVAAPRSPNASRKPKSVRLPWPLQLLNRFARLRRLPARLIGLGARPEHVRSLKASAP